MGLTPVKNSAETFYTTFVFKAHVYGKGSKYKMTLRPRTMLIDSQLHKRLITFHKPIPNNEEFYEMYEEIAKIGYKKCSRHVIHGDELPDYVEISDRFKELCEEQETCWKKKLDASSGTLLFQFNARTSIWDKNTYVRQVQSCADTNYPRPFGFPKISWARYFLYEKPIELYNKWHVNINNWYYRKEIKQEFEELQEERLNQHKL